MNKFILKMFVFFLAINLWNIGFFGPLTSKIDNNVTVAEAHHKPGHKCNGRKCGQPPTVSELPIQYMVLSGAVVIALSGGMVLYIRKQKMKNSLEV